MNNGYYLKSLFVVTALMSPSLPVWSSPGAGTELMDYMVQDTCVDARDRPIQGDPYLCTIHRDIKVGELSNYIVTDVDRLNGNNTYQATNSFPVMGMDGNVKVMVAKNLEGGFGPNFIFSYSPSRDGYDLMDTTNSKWLSIVRTSDGGCYDQIWSGNGSAANMADRAGGWVVFPFLGSPSEWPKTSSVDITTYKIQLTKGVAGCSNGHSLGTTFFNAPASYTFESGKQMTAIRSDHFASNNLSSPSNALERFYFTKQYGFTRWEAWMPQSACYDRFGKSNPICRPDASDYPLKGRCSVLNVSASGFPGLDAWGGQNWVRTDCRDETNYIALNKPQLLLDGTMGQNDGYVDIDAKASTHPGPLGAWPSNSPQNGHASGQANGMGWEITALGKYSNLTFGPYAGGLPAGHLNVTFYLKIDNNEANDDPVVDLDVYRDSTKTRLAMMTLTRKQFLSPGGIQAFTLPFDYDGLGKVEFRVFVHGGSYVYHEKTSVGY